MDLNRRHVMFGLPAVVLAGCGGGSGGRVAPRTEVEYRPVANAGYDAWVAGFADRAVARGVDAGVVQAAFRSAGYLPQVIEKDRNQTEFSRSLQDYLAITASDERIAMGRAELQRRAATFAAIEARYGVERQVVAAVWGVESFYGTRKGTVPVISALSTLAYEGRRAEFFESQLMAALKILQHGDVSAAGMTGSWAGAMGHTQFIPTSYLAYAVDFTGDGRRDIWGDDPTDALASTAAYLARSGWQSGQKWGQEVILPAGLTSGGAGDWGAAGVRAVGGGAVGSGTLILPAGVGGPAFVLYRNYSVIARYNNAQNYIIGVGHLADRLAGGPAIQGSFPPDAQGMSIAQRQELQRRLTAAGYDTEGTDGVIGSKTMAAISAWQGAHGVAVTGVPSLGLLAALG